MKQSSNAPHLYDLSPGQKALWFLQKLNPDVGSYNCNYVWEIPPDTRTDVLEKAIDALSEFHPSLRTRYLEVDGEPRQQIRPSIQTKISTVDARNWTRQQVEAYQEELLYQPFDLGEQVWEWVLIRRAAGRNHLVLVINHIISDLWSIMLVLRELSYVYGAACSGNPFALDPDRPLYTDFVACKEQYTGSDQETRAWEYWKDELSGDLPVLNLVADFPRKTTLTFSAASVSFALPGPLKEQADRLLIRYKGSAFVFYFAVYCLLLHRYTGQNDMVVGFPTAGRDRRDFSGVSGDFINTLVLRLDFSALRTFEDLFDVVKNKIRAALAHKDFPFSGLVEKIKARRDPSRFPIIDTMFGWEAPNSFEYRDDPMLSIDEQGREIWEMGAEKWERRIKAQVDPLDISMRVIAVGDRLRFHLDYNHHLFEETTVQRMLDHYQALLKSVLSDTSASLDALSFLSAAEHEQLTHTFNRTQQVFDPALSMVDRFERAVSAAGSKTALIFREEQISFHELNHRANRLARCILDHAAARNALIGIYLDRSVEMVVALLAVLKTGNAYVPLDPGFPAERIHYIIRDAGIGFLLARESDQERFDTDGLTIISVDRETDPKTDSDAVNRPVSPDDLAYVIYTSGSTGRPKGVQIQHRAFYNFLCTMLEKPGFTGDDRLLAVTTLSFDIAALEIFLPLISGGCLILADRDDTVSGTALSNLIARHRVTLMQATPATWKMMVDSGWSPDRPLTILSGGEALESHLADRLLKRAAVLWNMYGPTETTIWSTLKEIQPGVPFSNTIGKPIANTQVYVLDHQLRLQPVGVPGDLYIGGHGLAKGYHNRPDLTREKFIRVNPTGTKPEKLYQTGDLARVLPNGDIQYLGRKDFQVKVRGYRIEPGEIESRLLDHPDVSQALVTAGPGMGGEKALAGYVVLKSERGADANALRRYLRQFLPEYMIPAAVIPLDEFPLTPNRKVDRKALPGLREFFQSASGNKTAMPAGKWETAIETVWREMLGIDAIGILDNFFDIGGDSLLLTRVHHRLSTTTQADIRLTDLYRFPTIKSLAGFLDGQDRPPKQIKNADAGGPFPSHGKARHQQGKIAVIGMSGRFPGAENTDEFWDNLINGVESISFFSGEQMKNEGVSPDVYSLPGYVNAKGYLEETDRFDAEFFNISPAEAEIMDPQQRLFLECAWHALENAGYRPGSCPGSIGVYAGAGLNRYGTSHVYPNPAVMDKVGEYAVMVANDKDFLASRIAYKLNLQGPAIGIQTACSTALVAVHQARQALLHHDCDMALAGGVSLGEYGKKGYRFQEGMILSADGHCKAFSKAATGTVPSQGMGLVVLKRYDEAVKDRDTMYAVIRGTAVNNDGSLKVGYTAPSIEKQAEVIQQALAVSRVTPEDVSYIEAHGTGTKMGDPIEFEALKTAFANRKGEKCPIGAVKANIGHLDVAAGIAGLIKTALCLKNGQLPPTLHFSHADPVIDANPAMDLENSPFTIQTRLTGWHPGATKRIAGVSAFGIGGTNAHAVLEEPPLPEKKAAADSWHLLPLSARTQTALDTATRNLVAWLRQHPHADLNDVAYTLQVGREPFACRRTLLCKTARDGISAGVSALELGDKSGQEGKSEQGDNSRVMTAKSKTAHRDIVFMFPGQGTHYPHMGKGLYDTEPLFRNALDRCFHHLNTQCGLDLKPVLFPGSDSPNEPECLLSRPHLVQPAIFSIEYALARLWMSWGIRPHVLVGHSIGEYTAACIAGVFSPEEALQLVAGRGQLISELPGGDMLAVPLPVDGIAPFLDDTLSIAAVNTPNQSVLSGDREAIQRVTRRINTRYPGLPTQILNTSHAFHSHMLDPMLPDFRREFDRITLHAPSLPMASTVTGKFLAPDTMTDPGYWIRHTRETVHFSGAVQQLQKKRNPFFLEVGPGSILSSLVGQHPGTTAGHTVVSTMRSRAGTGGDDRSALLTALGKLWLAGMDINWQELHQNKTAARVPLPGYPFERKRFWIEPLHHPDTASPIVPQPDPINPPLKTANIHDWFYTEQWEKTGITGDMRFEGDGQWLLFSDRSELCDGLHRTLTTSGQTIITVHTGNRFARETDRSFTIRPGHGEDFARLINALPFDDNHGVRIIFGWGLLPVSASETPHDRFTQSQSHGLFSLLSLIKALAKTSANQPASQEIPADSPRFDIIILTRQTQAVRPGDTVIPDHATMNGLARVVHQEHARITCRQIDLDIQEKSGAGLPALSRSILNEFRFTGFGEKTAFRNQERWIQSYAKLTLTPDNEQPRLKTGGVYWITGGLGSIGFAVAEMIARVPGVTLVLSGRTAFPPQSEWAGWLRRNPSSHPIRKKIEQIREMEKNGASVRVMPCDVGELSDCKRVLTTIENTWDRLDGVVHAAGIPGDSGLSPIVTSTPEDFLRQFQSKAVALFHLDRLLGHKPLDFILLTSSISTLLGGIGYGAYASGNAFMNAFSAGQSRRRHFPWISVNLDAWTDRGESSTPKDNPSSLAGLAMTRREGQKVMETLLKQREFTSGIISTSELNARQAHIHESFSKHHKNRTGNTRPATEQALPAGEIPHSLQDLERIITQMWKAYLKLDRIGTEDNFFELGGDSLMGMGLVSEIRDRFGMDLSVHALLENPTISRLSRFIATKHNRKHPSPTPHQKKTGRHLVCIQKGDTGRTPLFLFPVVGGHVYYYRDLADALGKQQPIYGFQSRGLDGGQEPLATVEAIAKEFVDDILKIQPGGEYRVGGSSFGGVLAYEVAQQLRRMNREIRCLFMVNSPGPGHYHARLRSSAEIARYMFGKDLDLPLEILETMSIAAQAEYIEQVAVKNSTPHLLPPGFGVPFLTVFQTNQSALFNYTPRPYPGKIIYFRQSERLETSAQFPELAWTELAEQGLEVHIVKGNHFTMNMAPNVERIAHRLKSKLAE
ncbi:MAG: amino acid adenylation domain-containing protein [Desulfobacter sp.]